MDIISKIEFDPIQPKPNGEFELTGRAILTNGEVRTCMASGPLGMYSLAEQERLSQGMFLVRFAKFYCKYVEYPEEVKA